VLFGMRKVPTYDDVTAVILHDVGAEKAVFTLMTTDGSMYRARTIKPIDQNVRIDDASLGEVLMPLNTVAELRGN
jgi:hypothetical protein